MSKEQELESEAQWVCRQIAELLDEEGVKPPLQIKTFLKIQKLILKSLREVTSSSVLDNDS